MNRTALSNLMVSFLRMVAGGLLITVAVGCTQYGGKSSTPRRLEGQGAQPTMDEESRGESDAPAPGPADQP